MKRVQEVLGSALGLLVVVLLFGFGVETGSVAPDHALVLADAKERTYFAPSCVSAQRRQALLQIPLAQAHKQGLSADRTCVNESGFTEEGRSVSGRLLEFLGVLPMRPKRWNSDGTWNF